MLSKIKFFVPYIILLTFILLTYNFYSNNKSDFNFIYNLNYEILFKILILCFFYLITEAIILRKIVFFFNKKISLIKSFLVINTTYLCNTFVSFSGLGFRAFFLKKIFKINITDFVILSLFIILVEIFVFTFFGFILLIIADFYDDSYEISVYLKHTLLGLSILTMTLYTLHNFVFVFLINFFNIKNNKYIKKISKFFIYTKKKNLKKYLLSFFSIFFLQFVILFLIFYLGHSILEKENSFIFSIIATASTDLSFIFTLTPYAIGISEAFIFFGSSDLDINIAEIIFLTNLFRLSIFLIYFLIGLVHLYFFLKRIKK
jgi:uncharacterized membrane protein YbhN (UPF0104 family)